MFRKRKYLEVLEELKHCVLVQACFKNNHQTTPITKRTAALYNYVWQIFQIFPPPNYLNLSESQKAILKIGEKNINVPFWGIKPNVW